ncbi:MAG: 50S ribosomal protein L15 [Candidatus Peribacteria bacterium]|nr:MAG: 50S ribosomal protein L15 [Candidatus Peribacteria bacterium]
MLVHELSRDPGKISKGKRLGRGNSSGKGNYSGKGVKGQDARSGGGVPDTFEGGQTPLNRRLPKLRGFKRFFKLKTLVQPVNILRLDQDERVSAGTVITKEQLLAWGYIRSATKNVKLLGNEELTKKLSFADVDAASAGALAAIEKAGGTVTFAAGAAMQ